MDFFFSDMIRTVLIAVGLVAVIFFLKQFGILKGKGLVYAIAGAAAILGFSIFQSWRKNKIDAEFKKREEELKKKEEDVKELKKAVALSDEQVQKAEAALNQERGEFAKKIVQIEAEKEKSIEEAEEEISNMSISELLKKSASS